jgi:hypothetical protein
MAVAPQLFKPEHAWKALQVSTLRASVAAEISGKFLS